MVLRREFFSLKNECDFSSKDKTRADDAGDDVVKNVAKMVV
jgi:hypothetical protein